MVFVLLRSLSANNWLLKIKKKQHLTKIP
jgi:hypothetical protein